MSSIFKKKLVSLDFFENNDFSDFLFLLFFIISFFLFFQNSNWLFMTFYFKERLGKTFAGRALFL